MGLIPNLTVHKAARLTKDRFLDRVSSVEAIRSSLSAPLTVYPTSEREFLYIESLRSAIVSGNFKGLNRYYEIGQVFGLVIPDRVQKWIGRTSLKNLHRQIALYLAANAWADGGDLDLMRDQLYPPVYQEVERLYGEYFEDVPLKRDEDDDIVDDYQLYSETSMKYVGSTPPEILSRPFSLHVLPDDEPNWGIRDNFDIEVRYFYFTATDWKCVVVAGEEDPLRRTEASQELWIKWKEAFAGTLSSAMASAHFGEEARSGGGFVYVLADQNEQLYKIGFSKSKVKSRIASLQTGNPRPLSLVGCFPVSGPETERAIHRVFASARSSGEWFRLSPEQLNLLLDPAWRLSESLL